MNRPVMQREEASAKPQRGKFLYLEVARQLRARIENETYRPGAKIPGVEALCAEFGVSAITVRNALRDLSHEGLIHGHQGLGVFVRERPTICRVLAGNSQRSIGDEIERAGLKARIVEVSAHEVEADEQLAEQLKVKLGTRLYVHEKLTYAGDEPVALHTLAMSPKLARKLKGDIGQKFLFPMLVENGIEVANLRCNFQALGLSERRAALLGLPPGYPMLQIRYTPCDGAGRPILSGITLARSDRFSFEVDLPK